MRRAVQILVGGLVCAMLQGALLYVGVPSYLLPQFTIIFIVYLAFHQSGIGGAFEAFGLGLLMDFASAVLVGPWAGAFVSVYGAVALASPRMFVESGLVIAVTTFLSVVAADLVYLGLAYEYQPSSASYLLETLSQGVVTAAIAPVVTAVLRKVLVRKPAISVGRAMASGLA